MKLKSILRSAFGLEQPQSNPTFRQLLVDFNARPELYLRQSAEQLHEWHTSPFEIDGEGLSLKDIHLTFEDIQMASAEGIRIYPLRKLAVIDHIGIRTEYTRLGFGTAFVNSIKNQLVVRFGTNLIRFNEKRYGDKEEEYIRFFVSLGAQRVEGYTDFTWDWTF